MSGHRKYERAWDIIDNKWKTPEEVDYAIMHDKPRFISEKPNDTGDGGYILTLTRGTMRNYSNGKQTPVPTHFKSLRKFGLNTCENRRKLDSQEAHRESEVHKLCKELFVNGTIKQLHIKERAVPIVIGNTTEYLKIKEQDLDIIEVESVEKKDKASNKIPDIIVKAKILGRVQRFFIEIYYRHAVDQDKRELYIKNRTNCLEINVGGIYESLNKSSKAKIQSDLVQLIHDETYWISCNIEEEIKEGLLNHYNIIDTSTILHKSKFEIVNEHNRAYVFEDDLNLIGKDRPRKRTHNIGDCLKCSRCIGIIGHHSADVDNIHITCSIKEVPKDMSHEDKMSMVKTSINKWVANYAENIT